MNDAETTRSTQNPEDVGLNDLVSELVDSVVHLGTSIVRLPMTLLPPEPRRHFEIAGTEINQGISTLLRNFADRIGGKRTVEPVTQPPPTSLTPANQPAELNPVSKVSKASKVSKVSAGE